MRHIFIAVLSMVGCGTACAASLAIQPVSQDVTLGSEAVVKVKISGLGSATPPSLGAFDFDVGFNPSILSLAGISFGDPALGDQLAPQFAPITGFTVDAAHGLVDQFEVSLELPRTLDALQPGSFVLTTLWFNTLESGVSSLDISNVMLGDSQGNRLAADSIEKGSVNVLIGSAVPDSGSSALLLALVLATLSSFKGIQATWKTQV
jgi:hypothetical protein